MNSSKKRRFENAGEASKELYNGFNEWCSILTKHSIEAAFSSSLPRAKCSMFQV